MKIFKIATSIPLLVKQSQKSMKKTVLIALTTLALGLTAKAGVAFSVSFGPGRCVPAPVVCAPAPVVCAPAPVVYAPAPVVYQPAPVVYAPAPVVYSAPVVYPAYAPVYRAPMVIGGCAPRVSFSYSDCARPVYYGHGRIGHRW